MKQQDSLIEKLQWAGLALVLAALPFSNFLMSVGTFWLVGVWLLWLIADYRDGKGWTYRWNAFRYNRSAVFFTLIYLIFLVTLLWSSDWSYGLRDLKTKLPLLVFPIVISGLNPMSKKALRSLMVVFISALILAVTLCFTVYAGIYNELFDFLGVRQHRVKNIRDISIYISHIRFSLLLVLGIGMLYAFFFRGIAGRAAAIAVSAYFLAFLWVVESITGFAILGVLIIWLLIKWIVRTPSTWVRVGSASMLTGIIVACAITFVWSYKKYFTYAETDLSQLETHTAAGERYAHYPDNGQIENGHYIMIYIAWNELSASWTERSSIPFEGEDAAGNPVKGTLIRYLSSRGLRKDREGVKALTDEEIRLIEQGVPSVTWRNSGGINRRLKKIFFEWDNYRNGGNPSGHSVFQRIEFWRAGIRIARDHPWFGVGVGDVKGAFAAEYAEMNSRLDEAHRLRAHNQFLTVFITGGVIGCITFLILLFGGLTHSYAPRENIVTAFFIIAGLSFLTEDTLESQAGVTFFAFFSSFFLCLRKKP